MAELTDRDTLALLDASGAPIVPAPEHRGGPAIRGVCHTGIGRHRGQVRRWHRRVEYADVPVTNTDRCADTRRATTGVPQ